MQANGPQPPGIFYDTPQLGQDIPDQHQHREKYRIIEGQGQGGDMIQDQAQHPVQDGGHQDGGHGSHLVPEALPGRLAGPLPRLEGGGGAGGVVQQHTGHPRHHQPAEPSPQGGQAAQDSGYGGLEAVEPGWKRFRIAPVIGGDLTHAETSHITPYGKAEVQWEVGDNVLDLTVAVPAGTTAFVDIVDHERVDLVAGTHHLQMAL